MNKKYLIFILLITGIQFNAVGQNKDVKRPKLIVGLVVDQMRWDFLYRYQSKYCKNGFNELINNGFNCQQTNIHYSPTVTACGHASVYTGSVPGINGIVGNGWYDTNLKKDVYCVQDSSVTPIGTKLKSGLMSPKNMKSGTFCDELKLATNFKSKVIGVALKDRGAILPAGHSANAAYWFDGTEGNWISSSYYMNALPKWLEDFNAKKLATKYVENNWSTLLPISEYHESHEDDAEFEATLSNETNPVFTHQVNETGKKNPGIIRYTPFGNTLTLAVAKEALIHEKLGQGNSTDILTISLSSPDYIGHQFGPNSVEIEDNYLRLDLEIAEFINFLNKNVGKDNYTLFLTADHGAAHVPAFLNRNKIPAGIVPIDSIVKDINTLVKEKYSIQNGIITEANHQLYLSQELKGRKDASEIINTIIETALTKKGIAHVINLFSLDQYPLNSDYKERLKNSYYPGRSGDLIILYEPAWFDGFNKGTTHSVIYPYDTHIPLLFYGWGIKRGETFREIKMADIAPTISALLHIQQPNGNTGTVITELIKKK